METFVFEEVPLVYISWCKKKNPKKQSVKPLSFDDYIEFNKYKLFPSPDPKCNLA